MASTNYDIFISHKHTEWPFARSLFTTLSSKGYSCWYDADGLHSGKIDQIFEYIDNAKDVIIIVNKGNLKNAKKEQWQDDFFCREVAYALEKKKNIIPILLTEDKYLPKAHELQAPFQSIWQYKYLTCISSDSYDGLVHYTLIKKDFLKSEPVKNEYIQLEKKEIIVSRYIIYVYRIVAFALVSVILSIVVWFHYKYKERGQDIINGSYERRNIPEKVKQNNDSILIIKEKENIIQESLNRKAEKDIKQK